MSATAAFALVIMLSGWAQGTASSTRGNAIDHVPGFLSEAKCIEAGKKMLKASPSPQVIRTACVESTEGAVEGGPALILWTHGWDEVGAGARGNVVHHMTGFLDMRKCTNAGSTIKAAAANSSVTFFVCVERDGVS